MLQPHLALISETKHTTFSEVTRVAAALQKQVTRDFSPIWGVSANVSVFAALEDVPSDYWPVIVQDDIHESGAAGVHQDRHRQPFALVQFGDEWSLTASHEVLEMLCDPFGNRLVAGSSPKKGQGRVNFLVEVCDPSEDSEFAYSVNGVTVSDFYTPHFFDPVGSSGARYSFTGAIQRPRTILRGGYLSWVVAGSNEWFQQTWFGTPKPTIRSLGVLEGRLVGSLRSTIDQLTPVPSFALGKATREARRSARRASSEEVVSSSLVRARGLREAIASKKSGARKSV